MLDTAPITAVIAVGVAERELLATVACAFPDLTLAKLSA